MSKRIHVAAVLAGVLAAILVAAAPAGASVIVPPAGDCPAQPLTQPFRGWLDSSSYLLVGDGGFEQGADGWQLSRASVVPGNEPWYANGTGDGRALAIPAGGSATSPPVCVGLGHPLIRFFARNTGSPLGLLAVQVVVRTSLGTIALPVGVVANLSRQWQPSLPILTIANLLTLVDGSTEVSLRFTSVGLGSSWEIDDVFIDPYRKG